ncbi:MAG: DNA polymerase IV [Deltaproteobacteria bacterium]|nr:DNA polymerase IV [Deltaproteobacteria bacterium]
MHVDMNAFFASVEQRCSPALRGKPIAVVGSAKRTVVTTASYEARAFGVKTGMNRFEAKMACPQIIFVVGDNSKYIDASVRILEILNSFSPLVEAYSIDEAFIDITGCLAPFGTPSALAMEVKRRIKEALGLTCSIGIAPNKLLAKLASDMKKPDGLVIMDEASSPGVLEDLPAGELWGIGPRLTEHLGRLGIRTCGQLGRAPLSLLRDRFGVIGERLKLMGQGIYSNEVAPAGHEDEARSVGHSTTLPADTSEKGAIRRYLLKLSEMVGARAREHGLKGSKVCLTVRYPDFYTFSRQKTLPSHTNDTRAIYMSALSILEVMRLRTAVRLLGVSISGLAKGSGQMSLFEDDRRRQRLLEAMDEVNRSFGGYTITWGSLLDEGSGCDDETGVISPAWRPVGVKRINVK